MYMYHNFFIHSSVDGHLGCFHVLAIVNSAAVNNGMLVSLSILLSSGYILEKAMAPHSSILAWKIPWTEEPGRRSLTHKESDTTGQLHLFTYLGL